MKTVAIKSTIRKAMQEAILDLIVDNEELIFDMTLGAFDKSDYPKNKRAAERMKEIIEQEMINMLDTVRVKVPGK